MKNLLGVIFSLALVVSCSASAEPISPETKPEPPVVVNLGGGVHFNETTQVLKVSGQTTLSQYFGVIKGFETYEVKKVTMQGPGGYFFVSLNIGRYLMEQNARVEIPAGQLCVSACAFAAIAAQEVDVRGSLWFHAPYLPAAPTDKTIHEIASSYSEVYIKMDRYILEVGYSSNFSFKLIEHTSPCKFITVSTAEELITLRDVGMYRYEQRLDKC